MKTLFFYNEEWEKDYFEKGISNGDLPARLAKAMAKRAGEAGFEVEFLKGRAQDYPDLKDEQTEILSIFVGSQITSKILDNFPNLKYISTRSTGFDHIDIEEAQKRGIKISNVPDYGSVTVAEFTFALLLVVSRKIFPAYDQILEQGNFEKEGLRGFDLNGKILGVIGVGKIGQNVIKIANGFGMKVLAFDKNDDVDLADALNFSYVDLDELLKRADVISLHLPYNSHTHHLLDKEAFDKMKKGAVLLNTSRGGVIDTVALVEALKKERLAGAGLDVLEAEIYMGKELDLIRNENSKEEDIETVLHNQYLIEHPNVIITPHNAFNTQEAIERIFDTTIENIKAFQRGEDLNLI